MSHAANGRALARLESKGGAKESALSRYVGLVEQAEKQRRRAALALVAYAQELAGMEPPPEPVREEGPARLERSPSPRRERPPPLIPGSTNDPNSSAYIRPWVQEAVETPEVPDGPDMSKDPWAHWGFEPPPSYAREAEDDADAGGPDGESER